MKTINNELLKKYCLILMASMFCLKGLSLSSSKSEFAYTNFNSGSRMIHETPKCEIEYILIDNIQLVSVNAHNLIDKLDYLILDSKGSVLGGGVITKNITKIALKDFPKGSYAFKIIGEEFVSVNKFII
ncbi:MAG: hypothetical protein Q8L81_09740 [Bacteroidota bacterium]|nr:hypothetical protein [Bacteroidota bacterium]